MSVDPGAALQRAVVAALSASSAVAEKVGKRIFDRVPADGVKAVFPYLTLGDINCIDDTHCDAAWECFVTLHVWSRTVGKVEARECFGPIRGAIDTDAFTVEGFVVTDHEFQSSRTFPDPDGLTTHGVIDFRLLIDLA